MRASSIATGLVVLFLAASMCCAQQAEVNLGASLLLRVRCGSGSLTPQQRADAIQLRANALIKDGTLDRDSVRVERDGPNAVVMANGRLLVTVLECDARANGVTPEQLGRFWADRLICLYPEACPAPQPTPTAPRVPT